MIPILHRFFRKKDALYEASTMAQDQIAYKERKPQTNIPHKNSRKSLKKILEIESSNTFY